MVTGGIVYGFGVNDLSSYGNPVSDSKFYRTWASMIQRTISTQVFIKHPTYEGCSVCEEWKLLSNFKRWVDDQPNKNWEHCFIDKDLLFKGNKVYGPSTCVFVSREINNFLTDRKNYRGNYLLGVTGYNGKFKARCNNPFTKKEVYLGLFYNETDAHLAWKTKKHEYACQLADLQEDPRVAEALRNYYLID